MALVSEVTPVAIDGVIWGAPVLGDAATLGAGDDNSITVTNIADGPEDETPDPTPTPTEEPTTPAPTEPPDGDEGTGGNADGELPTTGANPAVGISIAGLLLALGGAFLLAQKKRQHTGA